MYNLIKELNSKVEISKEKLMKYKAEIEKEYEQECLYLVKHGLQYQSVEIEFYENELLTLIQKNHAEVFDYFFSSFLGNTDLKNDKVIDYIKTRVTNKELANSLDHVKKAIYCKECLKIIETIEKNMNKRASKTTYSVLYFIDTMTQGLIKESRYLKFKEPLEIITLENLGIDRVDIKRLPFNRIYMETLVEEFGLENEYEQAKKNNKGLFAKESMSLDKEIEFVSLIIEGYIDTNYVMSRIIELEKNNRNFKGYMFDKVQSKLLKNIHDLQKRGYKVYRMTNYWIDVYKE